MKMVLENQTDQIDRKNVHINNKLIFYGWFALWKYGSRSLIKWYTHLVVKSLFKKASDILL